MADPIIQLAGGLHGGDRVIRVSLGSRTKQGTKSNLTLPVDGLSEREIYQGVGAILMKLIEHQGRYFMDNHDEKETLAAGIEVTGAFLKDPSTVAWLNRSTWSPTGNQTTKTQDVPNMYRPMWS